MKFLQHALKRLQQEEIVGMGRDLASARAMLEHLHIMITSHIFKVAAMPKSDSRRHWIKELDAYRSKLSRYNIPKGGGKPNYNRKILEKWLWEDSLSEKPDRDLETKELLNSGYQIERRPGPKTLKKIVDKFIEAVINADKFNLP